MYIMYIYIPYIYIISVWCVCVYEKTETYFERTLWATNSDASDVSIPTCRNKQGTNYKVTCFFIFSIQELSKYYHTFPFPPAATSGCQT